MAWRDGWSSAGPGAQVSQLQAPASLPEAWVPPRQPGHMKEDLLSLMMLQNIQMHQLLMSRLTMSALDSKPLTSQTGMPPLVTQQCHGEKSPKQVLELPVDTIHQRHYGRTPRTVLSTNHRDSDNQTPMSTAAAVSPCLEQPTLSPQITSEAVAGVPWRVNMLSLQDQEEEEEEEEILVFHHHYLPWSAPDPVPLLPCPVPDPRHTRFPGIPEIRNLPRDSQIIPSARRGVPPPPPPSATGTVGADVPPASDYYDVAEGQL